MELNRPLATVTPTLDGDVLALLATSEVSFTTGQLHRTMQRASEEGIRRVLQRLTSQGVVLADRVGNAYAYRLNREHLAAEHIIGLATMTKTLLSRLENDLTTWRIRPIYSAVFGSAARGKMTNHSDLDLFLVRPDHLGEEEEVLWDEQVLELVGKVTNWTGNDTRPVQLAESQVVAGHPLLENIRNDGLTLVGTRAWLDRKLRQTKLTPA